MPPRNRRFLALDERFREFLDRRGGWPLVKQYPAALKGKGGGRKADIARMKSGGVVPEKYVRALAELLAGTAIAGEYLEARGGTDRDGATADALFAAIAGPLRTSAEAAEDEADDWHLRGMDGLAGLFTDFIWRTLIRPGTLCETEADVRTAVSMMMATSGRQVGRDPGLGEREAIARAEAHMRVSHDEYLGRALDLWRAARWTLAFGVVERRRVGCSFIVPLRESSYEQMRAGERNSHSCVGADVAVPTRTFFVEAVGHRSDAEYPDRGKMTAQVARTIYVQLAVMSLEGGRPLDGGRPLRLLSIGGNAANVKRLKRSGFRPTGTFMPGFAIEYMEMDERKAWWTPLLVGKLQERLLASGEANGF